MFVVYAVIPKPPEPARVRPQGDDSVLLTGVVGSGGYPWQTRPLAENPFEPLAGLFRGSRVVIAGYAPYRAPWYARLLRGAGEARRLEPSSDVPSFLAQVGVKAAAIVCHGREECSDSDVLVANGVTVIPRQTAGAPIKCELHDVRGVSVGVFALGPEVSQDSLEATVLVARSQVGAIGRLIAFVPATADYGRLPTVDERHIARRLVDLGVDVVAGLGGYAAKEVEEYKGGIIAYSLGTLLRPPTLSLANLDSTGIGLRVSFPTNAGRPKYDVVALTFDDRSVATLGRASSAKLLVRTGAGETGDRLADTLEQADVGYESADGVSHDLGPWNAAQRSPASASEQWLFTHTAALTEWFPDAPPNTPLRPFDGAYSSHGTYVARRGALSLGTFRRAIEIETGGNPSVWVRFKGVRLAKRLEVAFAVPDDRVRSKLIAFGDQRLIVMIAERELLSESMPYRVGWNQLSIDTAALSVAPQDIKIIVRINGTHFPVVIDARVANGD